jgi:hypothetical protein
MPAFDSGFKIAARTSGRRLADIAMSPVDEWLPVLTEVQTAERFADRAFRARRGREWFVVYLEAYTYWRKEAPWNLLAKSGLLSERERLPTACLVYILRPRGYKPQQGRFQLQVEGQIAQFLRLTEVCLWQVEPQVLVGGSPGVDGTVPTLPPWPPCQASRSSRCLSDQSGDRRHDRPRGPADHPGDLW